MTVMARTSLVEDYFLTAYLLDNGRLAPSAAGLDYGLSGAAMLELAAAARIRVRPDAVTVVDRRPTHDSVLDQLLRRIDVTSRLESPQWWLTKLRSQTRRAVVARLTEQQLLAAVATPKRRIIRVRKLYVCQHTIRREVVERLTLSLVADSLVDTRTASLVTLLDACGVPPSSVVNLISQSTTDVRSEWPRLPQDSTSRRITEAVGRSVDASMLAAWV